MARFMIEVPHSGEPEACIKAIQVFLSSGSHMLTNADWGCMDGDHRAWVIVDVESKQEAMAIVPPAMRSAARIIGLNTFTREQFDAILKKHSSPTT